MTTILRVFPRRTSYTPTDALAFVGDPPLWRPEADQVHVSVTFSWDVEEGERLAYAWRQYYPDVQLGGPAYANAWDMYAPFAPGRYVKHGVTFTTRGCDNACPWCLVPKHEGRMRLLPIVPGHILQDNNILQAPRSHQVEVFAMLRAQGRAVILAGGIQPSLVDDWTADQLRTVHVEEIWLACDTEASIPHLQAAAARLSFLKRDQLRCYALVGYGDDTPSRAAARLEATWHAGCMPFAQFYRDVAPQRHPLTPEWQALVHQWSRPAHIRAAHRPSLWALFDLIYSRPEAKS